MPDPKLALQQQISALQSQLTEANAALAEMDRLAAENTDLRAQVSALKAQVLALTQDLDECRNPQPEPQPEPEPEPEPPAVPAITRQAINLSPLVGLKVQVPADRYARFQTALVLPRTELGVMHADGVTFLPGLPFHKVNMAAGGTLAAFSYPVYALLINGVERARITVPAGATQAVFTGSLGDEADCHAKFEIVAYDANGNRVTSPAESLMMLWGAIDRNGTAKDLPDVVVQTQSYEWSHLGPTYAYARIPKSALSPVPRPLTPRTPVEFNTALPALSIERINLAPTNTQGEVQTHYPVMHKSGLVTTDNTQAYETSPMYSAVAGYPHHDGPRGVSGIAYPTFLRNGRLGKVYGLDPQAFWVVDATGTKRTLAGKRHPGTPPYGPEATATDDRTEIVGDWDASIPVSERFPLSSWGMQWDSRTLETDPTAPTIGGEAPHVGLGPVCYIADGHGYVLKLQFSATDRSVPAKITRAFPSADPWGIDFAVENGVGVLYVAERHKHRIAKWNVDTTPPTYMGDAYVNPLGDSYAYFDDYPKNNPLNAAHLRPGISVAVARSQPMIAPELIKLQDGFLYASSFVQQWIRRMNLTTGVWETCCTIDYPALMDLKSKFLYFDVSDGTFGPRGTIFATTFSNINKGFPLAFLPVAGTAPDGSALTHSKRWEFYAPINDTNYVGVTQGSKASENSAYAMAVAVSHGFVSLGAAAWGLDIFMQTTNPPVDYARAAKGRQVYRTKNYQLLWGGTGYGPTNIPLPWGEDADQDYWFQCEGHAA